MNLSLGFAWALLGACFLLPALAAHAHGTSADMSRALAGGSTVQWTDNSAPLRLELRQGLVTGPVQTLRARKGAQIQIELSADRNEEVHLHGYDITTRLESGQQRTLKVDVKRPGRFELETHSTHKPILVLEVLP